MGDLKSRLGHHGLAVIASLAVLIGGGCMSFENTRAYFLGKPVSSEAKKHEEKNRENYNRPYEGLNIFTASFGVPKKDGYKSDSK